MDNFTAADFSDLNAYEARMEYEAWLDSMEGDPSEREEMTDEEFVMTLPEGFDEESEGDWYNGEFETWE